MQIHSIVAAFVNDELLEVLDEFADSGRLRHWGVTTYGEEATLDALSAGDRFRTVQIPYSLLDRTLERRAIPALHDQGVGLILRSVLLQGALSPSWVKLPDHLQDLRNASAQVEAVAQGLGVPMSELAMRYAAFEPRRRLPCSALLSSRNSSPTSPSSKPATCRRRHRRPGADYGRRRITAQSGYVGTSVITDRLPRGVAQPHFPSLQALAVVDEHRQQERG